MHIARVVELKIALFLQKMQLVRTENKDSFVQIQNVMLNYL